MERKTKEEERTEWFEFAERDLKSAQILMGQEGLEEVAATELQQAVEKFLKGYLIYRGWELEKTHDIEFLLIEAAKFDKRFEEYYRTGRLLSGFYVKHRYPPLPRGDFTRAELESLYEKAVKLEELVRE